MRTHLGVSVIMAASAVFAQHGSTPAIRINESGEGARIFRGQCAGCHGIDGSGTGAGPALNTGRFKRGGTDEAIVATVSRGVPGTTMPAFSFDAKQMPYLVSHLRSLAIVRATAGIQGNADSGKMLFENHCAGCHTPSGTFTGPELSDVSARLSVAQLRQSITAPDSSIGPEHWSVKVRTKSGDALEGIRLNEDTSSVQFRESSGKLRSVLKKDLASFEIVRRSPMPSFAGKLSSTQIDDILVYLVRGQQK